jgi:alpha-glucosidase
MPEDNVHRGYGGGTHAQFHNVYGMQMVRATREGILKFKPDKRPFILSRANYLGGQRYAATWTGDNQSDWTHLYMSIPMILNLGLSGQPFSGPDIGGFGGNADGPLFSRWMGFGALLPFARAHSCAYTLNHEPWSVGPDSENICRIAITRRYILLPYFYTLFYIASTTGLPVARPLFFTDPLDKDLREEDRAFLLGEDLLVIVNIYKEATSQVVKIPKNVKWFSLKLDEHVNEDLPELKIKAGSIIPIQSPIFNVTQVPSSFNYCLKR